LLQILEDGRLTDAQGRTVDFKNTVIIMTSNLGTADLRKAAIGFGPSSEAVTYEKMKEKVSEELKRSFRPEFLNRIDEVIVFNELTREEVTEIVDLLVKRVQEQLEGQGLGLELTQEAKLELAAKGYDPALGALACALVLAAAGCSVDTTVTVDMRDDGSGNVTVALALDPAAVQATEAGGGKLEDRVRLTDLAGAGWTVSPWSRAADGSAT